MHSLFERYIEKLLAPIAAAAEWRMVAQGGFRNCLHPEDGAPALFQTKPDLHLKRGNQVGMVIDAKWKCLLDRGSAAKMGVKEADLHQMITYARIYDCPSLVLLYPRHAGLAAAMPVHYQLAGMGTATRLTIAAIDLTSHTTARADLAVLVGPHTA